MNEVWLIVTYLVKALGGMDLFAQLFIEGSAWAKR